MDIYIELDRKTIVVRQRWKYSWLLGAGISSLWTYEEKRNWHHKADSIIWNTWGRNYIALASLNEAQGSLRDFHLKRFNLEFDIEWVLDNEHWQVEVTKVPLSGNFPSRVDTSNKIVYVAAYDINNSIIDSTRPDISFNTFNHEYGHTLYPTDDYGIRYGNAQDGPYSTDILGLMTIGNEFRLRYVSDLKNELNTIIPNMRFTLLLT